jgi:hypothetical protein
MDLKKDSDDRAPIEFFLSVFLAGCALASMEPCSIKERTELSWQISDAMMVEVRKRMDKVEAEEK